MGTNLLTLLLCLCGSAAFGQAYTLRDLAATARAVPVAGGGGGGSPPAFVNHAVDTSGAGDTTTTISVTPSGVNRLMLVVVQQHGVAADPTSVVFNTSETCTAVSVTTFVDASGRFGVYKLVNPTATTANVVVTWGGTAAEHAVSVLWFSGVNQTTPLGTAVTDYSNANRATTSTTFNTTSSDLAFAACGYDASGTETVTAPATLRSQTFTGGKSGVVSATDTAGASTTTIACANSGSGGLPNQSIGFAIKP